MVEPRHLESLVALHAMHREKSLVHLAVCAVLLFLAATLQYPWYYKCYMSFVESLWSLFWSSPLHGNAELLASVRVSANMIFCEIVSVPFSASLDGCRPSPPRL